MVKPLLRFAQIVAEHPELQDRFAETAAEYVRLARLIVWDKLEHRAAYYEDANGWGSYKVHGRLVNGEIGQWEARPERVISDNLNKHYAVGIAILRLWHLTGEPEFQQRVKALFARAKTMWRHFPDEDRVAWNFWMPHGPYDMRGRAPRSWVGVHPQRPGYQAGEVAALVEVYNAGLVFSREDMARLVRSNHWMMPTVERPGWRSADGTSGAGTLWTALARFDQDLFERARQHLAGQTDAVSLIRKAYLERVVQPTSGWRRLEVKEGAKIDTFDYPLQPGNKIAMSVVVPNVVEKAGNGRVQLACQTRAAGELKIDLYDRSGRVWLGNLYTIEVADAPAYHAPIWDGVNPSSGEQEKGEYLIKWSLGGESRTQPVYVVAGQSSAVGQAAWTLSAGSRLSYDFKNPLHSERWRLRDARVVLDQPDGEGARLMVEGEALLIVSNNDDLPVRVSFRVWDDGTVLGDATANGPAWGVQTALGDRFAMRMVWRSYLNGDRFYAWLNTGENQWFSPRSTGINRRPGWNAWVFDFTGSGPGGITGNGHGVNNLKPEFVPPGLAAVFFMGGGPGSPLYIDQVKIEYP